ncbi:MAG: protein kinase domain-containing protein [Gammaproteobacteria bacterium]
MISDKYEVRGQLGQGSMGVVYKVCHTALGTTSALKVLSTHLTGNPDIVKRFYREARVMARLTHPNIVRVVDVQHDGALDFHYFVMEYVEGLTLRQYLREQGALPLRAVLDIARQVARALDYAHSYNPAVIHRDIKPSNIIIENDLGRVVVTDFGIAKEMDQTEATKVGTLLGTLKYCAPEQLRCESLDGSADIYALGMVMHELYTGAHLFSGLDEQQIVGKLLHTDEYELSFKEPTPPEFAVLVRRSLAKAPAQRYRRMADLLSDLEACSSIGDEITPYVVPLAPTKSSPPDPVNADITDVTEIERQIQELAEERERRLTVQLQGDARENREKAVREGAEQLAANLFEEARAREEAAVEHVRQRQFSLAREAYQEAARLFAQACEQAITRALMQRAEEEAKAVQNQVKSAREEAIKETAEELAPQTFGEAIRNERAAETALGQEEFTQARELYQVANRQFELARKHANSQRQHRQALVMQERATEAQQEAEARGAHLGQPEYRQAQEAWGQGNARFETQAFEEAAEAYTRARDGYQQAGQGAERQVAREAAEATKEVALVAQRETRQGGGAEFAADRHAEATATLRDAEQALTQQDYGEAQTDLERSMGLLRQIELNALADRQREQAKRARAHVQTLQQKASRTKAGGQSQRQVERMLLQAHRLFQEGSYPQAREKFEQAAVLLSSRLHILGALRHELITRPFMRYSVPLLVLFAVAALVYVMQSDRPPSSDSAPPSVSAWTPEQEGALVSAPGRTQTFAIQAQGGPQAGPLRYTWFLNEEKQAEGPQWTYRPEVWETGEEPKQVRVVVTDRDNRAVEKRWQIRVASEGYAPRIDEASPSSDSLEVIAGGVQKFSVRASDPDPRDPLALVWSLDGGRVAAGERWEFKAPATESSHRVTVEVKDQAGSVDQRSWQVRVKAAPASSARLTIAQLSPAVEPEQEIIIGVGQRQIFTIKGESPEQRALSYSWFLDGKKRGEGTQFVYRPRSNELGFGVRELRAVVADDQGHSREKIWRVRVRGLAGTPKIIAASPLPTQLKTLTAGAFQHFSVEASDPDSSDQLTYVWSLDGREMAHGTSPSWQLNAPYAAGPHTVEVRIVDRAGLETQRVWKIAAPASGGTVPQPSDQSAITPVEPSVPDNIEQAAKPQSNTVVRIEKAISSMTAVKPGDRVEFITEYSLTLPAGTQHALVEVTWALEKNGRKLGEEGVNRRMAKAGEHAAFNQFTVPKYMRSGRYAVEHKVQVADGYDIARSYFSVVLN